MLRFMQLVLISTFILASILGGYSGSITLTATPVLGAEIQDLSQLHEFEEMMEAADMASRIGMELNIHAIDIGNAHYFAANVAIAEEDRDKYIFHINKALQEGKKMFLLEELPVDRQDL